MDIKIHEIDYKTAKLTVNPLQGERGFLPPGIWLPVSVAAVYSGCTAQTVRLLYFAGKVEGLKFNKGPLLIDVRFLPSLLKRSRLKEV